MQLERVDYKGVDISTYKSVHAANMKEYLVFYAFFVPVAENLTVGLYFILTLIYRDRKEVEMAGLPKGQPIGVP